MVQTLGVPRSKIETMLLSLNQDSDGKQSTSQEQPLVNETRATSNEKRVANKKTKA